MSIIKINGTYLFIKVVGNGNPILLMHGGPGVDHSTLLPLLPLSKHFKLIFYDHRCNGRSDRNDVNSMTWENLTADADALRSALGFQKWTVFGHSFGGMVALEYSMRYPQSVSNLILADTCADSYWVQKNSIKILAERGYRPATLKAADRFYNGKVSSLEMFTSMLKFGKAYYYKPSYFRLLSEVVNSLSIKVNHKAFVQGFNSLLKGWSVMDRLDEIICPTMILAGEYDFQFPPEHQETIAKGIINSRLNIIKNAGHNIQKEKPNEVMRFIEEFINR